MSDLGISPVHNLATGQTASLDQDEKYVDEKQIDEQIEIFQADLPQIDVGVPAAPPNDTVRGEWRRKIVQQYGRYAEAEGIAPAADITAILDRVAAMTEEDAMTIVLHAIETHGNDLNFPEPTMQKLKLLVQGYKIALMDPAEWEFDLKCEAAILRYHSPYPEVRSVTEPFDDPTLPVETIRSYVLGVCLMAGTTALNSFFSPRQPSISISGLVLQCLLAPLGQAWAKVMPDWGVTVFGTRHSLNPGPWTFKEQVFAALIFTIGNGAGATYYTYLVQMMPQFLGQTWVSFGYEFLLAVYAQMAGFGFAGLLRRFVVYPAVCIWPSSLPNLALNRVLTSPQKEGEVVHGWRMSRYKFFMIAFVAMFVWFWVPNTFFTALHAFNWMTWISPNNLTLAIVTGFYGGMGFNPWATFDWNVAGTGKLVTPFWSTWQSYCAGLVTAAVNCIAYYTDFAWGGYMPLGSNEIFTNKGKQYDINQIMGDDGYINVEAYKKYGPPFYATSNVFGQGKVASWYPITFTYVLIRYWDLMKNAALQMWRGLRGKADEMDEDAHMTMMRKYKEAPDWWYLCLLVVSVACGIAAVSAFPTHTPWWALIASMAIGWIMLIPATFILAIANITAPLDILFKILSGVWFPGNPMALIILETVGPAFDTQTESLMGLQKTAHYAKIPPRAVFRGIVGSTIINCMIFIGMLNWMVNNFDAGGTLCTWDNPEHFVCTAAVQDYAAAVMYGAFGIKNMWTLYPMTGWALLIGAFLGTGFAVGQNYGPGLVDKWRRSTPPEKFEKYERFLIKPFSWLYTVNPPVVVAGMTNGFTGGHNLSYDTNGVYISYIFMHHIKRRYPAWWEKYNFLLEAGFDIGVAVSGTIQTLAFAFTGSKFPKWWGNTISEAGIDYKAYNQNAARLPIPKVGYFGPSPQNYPLHFPKDLLDGTKGVRTNSTSG